MMMNYEVLQKLESNCESVIKKIQKAYSDIEPEKSLSDVEIKAPNGTKCKSKFDYFQ